MKGRLRHKIVYKILQHIMTPFLKAKFNYRFEKVQPLHQPAFILPNHVTSWDPLLVGLSFPQMMYYVASDHLFRLGFVSRLIEYLVSPIPRTKSSTDRQTAAAILRRIKEGANICIFPEGNMTFSGVTGELHSTTAKLIKHAGIALITYRLEGGYFTQPRWTRYVRRGVMSGFPVREYSPQEIASMTEEELIKHIEEDLYTDAYEEQKRHPVAYRGKRLAENLETALYICPSCSSIGELKSENNILSCGCGLKLRYTEYGYLEPVHPAKTALANLPEEHSSGSQEKYANPQKNAQPDQQESTEVPFTTIRDWVEWQTEKVGQISAVFQEQPNNHVITCDDMQSLWKIKKARVSLPVGKGRLLLYKDRLVFETKTGKTYEFLLHQISDMAIHGQKTLIFTTTEREYYELKSKVPRSALKYYELYKTLTGQHSIHERRD